MEKSFTESHLTFAAGANEKTLLEKYGGGLQLPMDENRILSVVSDLGLRYELFWSAESQVPGSPI